MNWRLDSVSVEDGATLLRSAGGESILTIQVAGVEAPILYVDDVSVARLDPAWSQWISYPNQIMQYSFSVKFVGPGNCELRCEFDGSIAFTVSVEVSDRQT